MMNINVNQPMSPAQLAALYRNNPMQADFDMPAQARGFVHEQASRMGITSPANHFATLQQNVINTAALSAAPNGWAQIEAAKQAVVDKMPSRAPAEPNYYSPLAQQEAQRLGMTPSQFATDMKLRNAGVPNVMGSGVRFNNATAADLQNDSRFQRALREQPEQAGKLFTAVTGDDYGNYTKLQNAMSADRLKFQRDTAQEKIKRGDWKMEGGKMLSRKLIPNPSGTGEMILSDTYSPLDETEQQMFNPDVRAAVVDPEVDRYQSLLAKKNAAPAAAQIATLQTPEEQLDPGLRLGGAINTGVSAVGGVLGAARDSYMSGNPNPIPAMLSQIPGVQDTINNLTDVKHGIWNMFVPAMQAMGGSAQMREALPQIQPDRPPDIRRMRATLQNNPQFQQLLQTDPKRALALVAAMQNQ